MVLCVCVCAGTGKTTFIRMLAGGLKPDGGGESVTKRRSDESGLKRARTLTLSSSLSGEVPILNVSYKPQTISPKFKVCSVFKVLQKAEGLVCLGPTTVLLKDDSAVLFFPFFSH